ncbi:MAG: hypothetical protein RL211_12 [Pseudomonadota bacterium]|jgi:NAD(P)-dependent dehydrogenase (short-subunit alcohol dehydrogenase family)
MVTNLDGAFEACAPAMRQSGSGSIVNIASISGLQASTLRVAYGTSKAALIHLTKQQAVELGHVGISVNAIAPGHLLSPVQQAASKRDLIQCPAFARTHGHMPVDAVASLGMMFKTIPPNT